LWLVGCLLDGEETNRQAVPLETPVEPTHPFLFINLAKQARTETPPPKQTQNKPQNSIPRGCLLLVKNWSIIYVNPTNKNFGEMFNVVGLLLVSDEHALDYSNHVDTPPIIEISEFLSNVPAEH
jgi:hypothetical protein